MNFTILQLSSYEQLPPACRQVMFCVGYLVGHSYMPGMRI
jgi:hypothetical protein